MKKQFMKIVPCLLLAALLLTACQSGDDSKETGTYDSYEAWVEALGYTPNTPASLPGKDYSENYAIEEGNVAKATYSSADQVIIYRTVHEEDRELVSFEGYDQLVGTSTCRGYEIELYGDQKGAHVAQWSEGGKTFAVFFKEGVTEEVFDEFIQYI